MNHFLFIPSFNLLSSFHGEMFMSGLAIPWVKFLARGCSAWSAGMFAHSYLFSGELLIAFEYLVSCSIAG